MNWPELLGKVRGKRVLLRVDFNVPIAAGKILDASRIRASIPTIRALLRTGASVILVSHLGRPAGKRVKSLSLAPIARYLRRALRTQVQLFELGQQPSTRLALLENVRFYPEELKNDREFAARLARLADFYVNDALSVCHRAEASVCAITQFLQSCAGPALQREYAILAGLLAKPARPFVVILGGAKVADKVKLLRKLVRKADKVCIGGLASATFLKAAGWSIGATQHEPGLLGFAKAMLAVGKIVLPKDVIAQRGSSIRTFSARVDRGWLIRDIGPATAEAFAKEASGAASVFWNGPLGWIEGGFLSGTRVLARALARTRGLKVAAGGDTAAAIARLRLKKAFSHLSLAGGAALALLAGEQLPGLKVLGLKSLAKL